MIVTRWLTGLMAVFLAAARSRGPRASPPQRGRRAAAVTALVILLAGLAVVALYVARRERGVGDTPVPPEKRPQQTGYSRIEIRSVAYVDGRVRVEGVTDLPDGAIVNVDFNIAGPPDTEADDAVSVNTEVRKGAFTALIEPPRTPAFARGPYVVDVLFSPRAQHGGVLGKVGADGERLEGAHAGEAFGFRVLEVSKQVNIKLSP